VRDRPAIPYGLYTSDTRLPRTVPFAGIFLRATAPISRLVRADRHLRGGR